uniref:Fibronectin type-III domain-containing protein n=1 Tax=Myotis myotis TaxID=51298 RepID=A0A7J7YE04_MYOMY|nr:hypothetical protein mMyoMyo1_011107 [Myotis myotis]
MEPEHPVGNWQKHNVDGSLLTTVGSLLEDETYTVRMLAFTSVGDGPLSDPIQESIVKYELLFREGDHGREVGRTFDPATAFVVDDLKPNTEYAFRLAARSPQGLGALTSVVRQRILHWRPPPLETHNRALVSYSVRYRPLGSEDPQPKEMNGIPPTTTQILLEALDKWTEYRITTVAHTEVGPGPESSPMVSRTDENVPNAPPRKIRGYQAHYVRMEGAEARGPPRIKDIMLADAQEMVITNLQLVTTYSITVTANTMKGDGARSKPKVVVTKGAVLGYRLQFGREDSSPLATLEFLPTEDHYTASGVHKGATYVFRLAARSRGGLGKEAAEVLSIPEDTPCGHRQIL